VDNFQETDNREDSNCTSRRAAINCVLTGLRLQGHRAAKYSDAADNCHPCRSAAVCSRQCVETR